MTAIATTATALVVPADVELLPDNNSFTNRFDFVSSSGNKYRIAQSISGRWWSCSCPGYLYAKGHKPCKHLKGLGLPGFHTAFEVAGLQLAGAAANVAPIAPAPVAALVPAPVAAPAPTPKAPKAPKASPKGAVVPQSVETKGGKIVVTFDAKDAAAVFALLAAMA